MNKKSAPPSPRR